MAEYSMDLPPGTVIDSSYLKMLRDLRNRIRDPSVAPISQPNGVADSQPGTALATGSQDDEMGVMIGVADNSRENSHDPIDAGDGDGVLFRRFQYLPSEVRIMIWTAAAVAAKPKGVYQFKVKDIKLGLSSDNYPLSPSLFTHIRQLDNESPLVHEIRDLMQSVYKGDWVSTFTPLPEVGTFTREIRDLLRSCPEARHELIRNPALGFSSFSFHRVVEVREEAGTKKKCDLGVIRPFCYGTDWVSLTDMATGFMSRHSTPGVLCTPDVARVEHLAVPHLECFCGADWRRLQAQMRVLSVFPGLRSLGIYDPNFSVRRVSHWDRVITQDQRFFLKGVSAAASGARPGGRALTGARFSGAMRDLVGLIQEVAVKEVIKKMKGETSPSLGGLNFCFLLHAGSQAGLDLMKFREDGSHLDDVERIEELGALGQELKALQINAA